RKEAKRNFKIYHNGSWVKGDIIKLPINDKKLFKIKTSNNKEIIVTEGHINPTLEGDKKTIDLSKNDYLLFNNNKLNTYPRKDLGLTYEQGILIGAYLGDGSIYKRETCNSYAITFSFNENKYNNLLSDIKTALNQLEIDNNLNLNIDKNGLYSLQINSIELNDFIREWVAGDYCYEKELNLDALIQSADFRRGILDGIYKTDGGNSNRIYTTSKTLAEHLEVLITSLGMNSTTNMSDRTDEKVIIRNEEYQRNYPLYCVRWYNAKNKRSMKDIYKIKNNSIYFKIKSIEEFKTDKDFVYCFEMENKTEPYFTLPNGIITHNCRLVNDRELMEEGRVFNSIGGSELDLGSTKVVTLNLAHLALLSDDWKEFIKIVEEKVGLIHKFHYAHRKTLKKLIDKGLLPLYESGMMDMDNQFATVGINGVFEAMKILGGINKDNSYNEKGYQIAEVMFNTIEEKNSETPVKYGYVSNTEQVPAESATIKLNKKDRLYFGNRVIDNNLGEDCYIYGNQWIPLKETVDLHKRIEAAKLDQYCGGGAILHVNLGENFNTFEDAWKFTIGLAKKGVKYFSYISLVDICDEDHSFFGDVCPICGGESVTKGIKIVGYPVKQDSYKEERKQELHEREFYNPNQ
ncbi:MAG: anaerobic ribonucleoside-triphosphate reductase, partial [Halanaerobium sp.]